MKRWPRCMLVSSPKRQRHEESAPRHGAAFGARTAWTVDRGGSVIGERASAECQPG
jgi:hypothetical protein